MVERDAVWHELTDMWSRRDPMPGGLVDKVLASLAAEDVDAEYELLHLVERSRELQGARGNDDALTIEFSGGPFAMLLHVTAVGEKSRRVDGWVAPAKPMKVSVRQESKIWNASVSLLGRFEFPQLPVGLSRFWLHETEQDTAADDAGQLFATPTFEL